MFKQSAFFRKYCWLMLIWACIGIGSSVLWFFNEPLALNTWIQLLLFVCAVGVIMLSVRAIAVFRTERLPAIAMVLPWYHLVALTLLFVINVAYGVWAGFSAVVQRVPLERVLESIQHSTFMTAAQWSALISSSLELLFVGFLLFARQKQPAAARKRRVRTR